MKCLSFYVEFDHYATRFIRSGQWFFVRGIDEQIYTAEENGSFFDPSYENQIGYQAYTDLKKHQCAAQMREWREFFSEHGMEVSPVESGTDVRYAARVDELRLNEFEFDASDKDDWKKSCKFYPNTCALDPIQWCRDNFLACDYEIAADRCNVELPCITMYYDDAVIDRVIRDQWRGLRWPVS